MTEEQRAAFEAWWGPEPAYPHDRGMAEAAWSAAVAATEAKCAPLIEAVRAWVKIETSEQRVSGWKAADCTLAQALHDLETEAKR